MELTGQKEFFTGNVNEDKKMLLKIGNSNIMMEACNSPTAIENKYCNEKFFEERVKLEFPDKKGGDKRFESWKDYYIYLLEKKQIKSESFGSVKKAQEYLLGVTDMNLLEICVENPKNPSLKSVCNEEFWKTRYEKRFGKINKTEKTWRNEYLKKISDFPQIEKFLKNYGLTGREDKDFNYIIENYNFNDLYRLENLKYTRSYDPNIINYANKLYDRIIKNEEGLKKIFIRNTPFLKNIDLNQKPKEINWMDYYLFIMKGEKYERFHTYWKKITDDNVWKNIVEINYPDLLKYIDEKKINTWKEYYFDIIKACKIGIWPN